MASFSVDTPLEELELSYVSEHVGPFDWRKLGLYLGIPENRLSNWERQYLMNTERAAHHMLFTWRENQRPNEGRRLLVTALENCRLRNLGDKIRNGECRRGLPTNQRAIPPANFNDYPPPQQPAQQPKQQAAPKYAGGYHNQQQQNPPLAAGRVKQETGRLPGQPEGLEISEILLRDLSHKLGSEWRMVGTYLGFENSQIQVLQEQYPVIKECIFQMLLEWRKTTGIKATKKALIRALKKSERADLEEFVNNPDDDD